VQVEGRRRSPETDVDARRKQTAGIYLEKQTVIINQGIHCTIDFLFDWFGISCMTTENFCFYLQNRLIQTKQEVNGTVILFSLVFPELAIMAPKLTLSI